MPEEPTPRFSESATADDVFGTLGNQAPAEQNANVLSLKQPPKWLRRPVSATFGFGGLLTSTSNLPGSSGKHQSGVVHLRNIVTEQGIIDRARSLSEMADDKERLQKFCNDHATDKAESAWETLQSLFKANSKEELVQLLGFSKENVAKQVEEAIKLFPSLQSNNDSKDDTPVSSKESETDNHDEGSTPTRETAPSETSATSDHNKTTESAGGVSLFDDDAPGTPSAGASTDFFSSMAAGALRNPSLDHVVPHKSEVAESSVGATIGSRASSIRSEVVRDNTFRIYPPGESEVDRLVTQALVLGDFASAVDLCLASERYADALLLAVRGGPDLLQSTQKAYFTRRTTALPFLRLFQSIVTEDLADIVQNADLGEWKVVFVVLCTFAKSSEFNNLADQLGQRLQHKWRIHSTSDDPEAKTTARTAREDATLCYLAARRLEKVVSIWTDELREEEQSSSAPRYTAHAQALQTFIEKVSVFVAATGYTDDDLSNPTESAVAAEAGARSYKLSALYDRYYEYADLLATQGLVDIAAQYVQRTPSDYKGTGAAGNELDKARDRLLRAAGISGIASSTGTAPSSQRVTQRPIQAQSSISGVYAPAALAGPHVASAQTAASPYVPPASSYAPSQPVQQSQQQSPAQPYAYGAQNAYTSHNTYQSSAPSPYAPSGGGYGGSDPQPQGYGAAPGPYGVPPSQGSLPPPPRSGAGPNGSTNTLPPIPAAQRRDIPGWNDAPNFAPPKRPQSTVKEAPKPAPIMSPFPMSQDPMASQGYQAANIHGNTPPPPRASQPGMLPPPPKGGARPPSAQAVARGSMGQTPPAVQQARPPPQVVAPPAAQLAGPPPKGMPRGGPPPPGVMAGPPPRALSPLGPQGRTTPSIASVQHGRVPQAQAVGPPPPMGPPRSSSGALVGGPPPPSRQTPQQSQIPPVISPSATPAPVAPAPASTKPSHRQLDAS